MSVQTSQQGKITLFWMIGSQPARAVQALLRIGKIPHQLVSKDVAKEQTRSQQFLAKNPLGQVPYLQHEQVLQNKEMRKIQIGQSNAILVYLCERFSSQIPSHYYGSTPEQRAATNQYISWYQYFFRPALFKIIKLKIYGKVRKNQDFKVYQLKSARREMFSAIKTLELLLKKHEKEGFINGKGAPTIADLLIFFELTNLEIYGESFEEYEKVSALYKKIEKQIPEVHQLTQQWRPVSKDVKKLLDSVLPEDHDSNVEEDKVKSKL